MGWGAACIVNPPVQADVDGITWDLRARECVAYPKRGGDGAVLLWEVVRPCEMGAGSGRTQDSCSGEWMYALTSLRGRVRGAAGTACSELAVAPPAPPGEAADRVRAAERAEQARAVDDKRVFGPRRAGHAPSSADADASTAAPLHTPVVPVHISAEGAPRRSSAAAPETGPAGAELSELRAAVGEKRASGHLGGMKGLQGTFARQKKELAQLE
eukprot:gene32226-40517_t